MITTACLSQCVVNGWWRSLTSLFVYSFTTMQPAFARLAPTSLKPPISPDPPSLLTCNLPVGLWCTRHRISSEMNAKRSRSVLSTSAMNNSHTVRDLDGIMPAVADWLRAGWTVCRATGRVGAITDRAQRSTAVPSVDAGGDGTASPNLQAHTTLFHVLEWTYSRSPAPSRVVPVGSIRPFSPCHIRSTKMYVIIKLRQTLQD